MSARRIVTVLVTATLAAGVPAADEPEKPKDLGLTERTSTRLAQLDVTVLGAKDAIHGLSVADFEVRLNDKLVSGLIVDDLCTTADAPSAAHPVQEGAKAAAPAPHAPTASYLFYFDMPHLTQGGRRGAIDAARAMLPKLLAGGNRATIVANAGALTTLVPLTDNIKTLDDALGRLINDVKLFDTYASLEEKRLAEIVAEMDRGINAAMWLAYHDAAEERFRQECDLRRFSMVLGRFADVDPPKAALYFADTMRQNAGEHYLSYFSGTNVKPVDQAKPLPLAAEIQNMAATGALPLDRVMNEASAFGVRVYAVEGQGITAADTSILSMSSPSRSGNQAMPNAFSQRTRDAQETLNSLAAETGGRSFINGLAPARMASRINDDMSCVYLLSFDPKGFPQDKPLAVSVAIKKPQVKAFIRGRFVVQSDENRLTARVLSAFANADESTAGLRAAVVPVSYVDGNFKARVQIAVPGSVVPDATWDLGASLVGGGFSWEDGSGRVEVKQPGVPVAYERDMKFSPGEFELVAVAYETTTDTLLSHRTAGKFPDIDDAPATITSIAVGQQARGGFLRNGASATQGSLFVPEGEPLQPGVPTAIMALVCRAKNQKGRLTVSRTLIGETETPVGSTDLDLGKDERCGQIVDLIPAKFLGPGSYRLAITVSGQGGELAKGERALVVP